MKFLIITIFFSTLLLSKVYYSKVEPYEIRDISSNVSGLVLFTDENMIGSKLSSKPYIVIDSELDRVELQYIEDKLIYLRETISFNQEVLKNLQSSLEKKRANYKRVSQLKIKSVVEKDREFYDLIASENQYLSTKKEINSLKLQITDLKLRKSHLKRTIKDKKLIATDFVLYSISVKSGQVVGIATPLAQVADISRAKLTIYLDEEDMNSVKNRVIYIDGVKTEYKISRVLHIADSKNISKYMAQIIIKSPKLFSKLLKIELRDE